MNQVEALEQAILKHAEEMADESRKSAETGRRNILRESSEKLHLREEKETLLAKSLADRAYLRKVQADELKLRSKLDHMRWNLVQLVIQRLAERMHELREDEGSYLSFLQALLKQAADQIEAQELEIACNADDRRRLQPQWQVFTQGLAPDKRLQLAEESIETLGGLRITTLDQRIRIDHTFEGRLARLQRKIQLALVERLLPPFGDGLPL